MRSRGKSPDAGAESGRTRAASSSGAGAVPGKDRPMQEVRAVDARVRAGRPLGVPQNLPRDVVERIQDEAAKVPARSADAERRRVEEARRERGEHVPGAKTFPGQGEQLDPGHPLPTFNEDGSVKLTTADDFPDDMRPPTRVRMTVAEGPVHYGRTEEDVNRYGHLDSEPVNPTDAAAKALARARNDAPLSDHERQQRGPATPPRPQEG